MAVAVNSGERRQGCLIGALVVFGAFVALAIMAWNLWPRGEEPKSPETIVAASLAGLQEQNVLVPFTARYVAVVTSRETTLGLTAQKTLILPATVRYEIDLAKLTKDDLRWDEATRTLTVDLPPVRLAGPEFDFAEAREYRDGEIVLALTRAEDRLDSANRKAAGAQIVRQAGEATPMRLARNAAKSAIETTLSLPLKASGMDAKVVAQFGDVQD